MGEDTFSGMVILIVWAVVITVIFGGLVFILGQRRNIESFPMMQFVSGTEYNIGEAGQVIVEARFANGTSALGGVCGFSIWYPNKSLFMSGNGTTGPNGNQYINFIIPNATGVYEYQAICSLVTNINGTISKSFHVSEFQNATSARLNRIRAEITK